MTQKRNRALSFVLAIALLFSLTAGTGFAAYAAEAPEEPSAPARTAAISDVGTLTFDGTNLTHTGGTPLTAGKASDKTCKNGSWFVAGNTLYLKNFNYTTTAERALQLKGASTLVVEGTNTIASTNVTGQALYGSAVAVTIRGKGHLNAYAKTGYAGIRLIHSGSSLTVDGPSVTASTPLLGVFLTSGPITVKGGGTLAAQGSKTENSAGYQLGISCGSLSVEGAASSVIAQAYQAIRTDVKPLIASGLELTASKDFNGTAPAAAVYDGTAKGYKIGATLAQYVKIAPPVALKKGSTFTAGKYKYKITNANVKGKGTVTLVGFAKGKSAVDVKVAKVAKNNGISYKITAVGKNAFRGNKKIKTATIGNNVKTIGSYAFRQCTKLTKVTVGNKVTKIGNGVFYKCNKLKTVTIGKGLKSIGDHNFCHNKAMKTITIQSTKLAKVGRHNLYNHQNTKIKVPKSKVRDYKKLFSGQGVHDAKVVKI